jgi:hypothetical protein
MHMEKSYVYSSVRKIIIIIIKVYTMKNNIRLNDKTLPIE